RSIMRCRLITSNGSRRRTRLFTSLRTRKPAWPMLAANRNISATNSFAFNNGSRRTITWRRIWAPIGLVAGTAPGGRVITGEQREEDHAARRIGHRGGSFLCSDQYCSRYTVGTRGKGEVNTGTNHLGFRCVITPQKIPKNSRHNCSQGSYLSIDVRGHTEFLPQGNRTRKKRHLNRSI